jgi:hypothetical protein
VTPVVDLRYDPDGLRAGGRLSREAADVAASAVEALAATPLAARPFGDVPLAGQLAGVLTQVRQAQLEWTRAAAADGADAGDRAERAAAAGDDLVAASTAVAESARTVVTGMA